MVEERGQADGSAIVVVPRHPGPITPLERPASRRGRDDLDELIDELFPDVEDGPGRFDVTLVGLGAVLLAWWLAGGPALAAIGGAIAATIGAVLPLRFAWRWVRSRTARRRRATVLGTGVPLDVSSAVARRLVSAYEAVLAASGPGGPEAAAAHGALLEAASLLQGRPPATERQTGYLDERAAAIDDLAVELRALPSTSGDEGSPEAPVDPDAVADARDELDQLGGSGSVERLRALADEVREQRRGGA